MSYSGRKDRARRIPQEKGIPRKLELRQIIIIIKINTIVLPLQFNDYYIACAVTSNSLKGTETGAHRIWLYPCS
jgi:hypothetical protein